MYKVFLNERIFALASNSEFLPNEIDFQKINFDDGEELSEIVNYFLKESEKSVLLISKDPGKIWLDFRRCFRTIKAAGGVVLKNNQILFIYRRGKWDLPKGKVDKGESVEAAAVREVEEECGITAPKIVNPLPATWHIYSSPYKKNRGEWILKETSWFEMEYSGGEIPSPQTEEDIEKAVWIAQKGFGEILENTYPNLEQVIRLYL